MSNNDNSLFSSDISSPGYIQSVASSRKKTKEDLRIDSLIPSDILENSSGMEALLKAYYTMMNLEEFIYQENVDFTDTILDGKAVFRISDPESKNNKFFTDESGADSSLVITDIDGTLFNVPLTDVNVSITNGNELPGSLALSTSEIGKTFTVLIPNITKKSAILSAIVNQSGVVTGFVGDLGYRYSNVPTITIAAPESGVQATATASLYTIINPNPYLDTSGSLQISITNGGSGYSAKTPPEVVVTLNPDAGDVIFSANSRSSNLNTIVKYWAGPGPSYALNTIEEAMDIDSNSSNYLELMQKEIASVIPRSLTANKRNLYKNIIDFYKVRGSTDSIEIFFRLLFNDSVEVEYPYESTLIPSSGNWEVNPSLPKGGQYLDNKGFLSYNIKIQDSLRYQKFSYLIRTGKNLSAWENVFDRLVHPAGFIYFGEILILLELTKDVITGVNIDGRSKVYSAMSDIQPGVIGLEDYMLLVEAFASTFLPTTYAKIHRSAQLSLTLNASGAIIDAEVSDGGWGYSSPPSITIAGQPATGFSITPGSLTAVLDSNGSIESVTINNAGLNYQFAFASPAANPLAGKLQGIEVVGRADKRYKTAPSIVFPEPTATDSDGLLLSSNQIAIANYTLDAEGEITGVNIVNAGSGYINDPRIRIASSANNEIRARDIHPKIILYCNYIEGMARSIVNNNYYNNKTQNFYTSSKLYDFNQTIEYFGDREIQSTDLGDINKYNVNSFIHT